MLYLYINNFVLSIFECQFYTGFTVQELYGFKSVLFDFILSYFDKSILMHSKLTER